jgi:hypothetical protein
MELPNNVTVAGGPSLFLLDLLRNSLIATAAEGSINVYI